MTCSDVTKQGLWVVSWKAFKANLCIPLKLPLAFINQPKILVATEVRRKIKVSQGDANKNMRLLAYYAVSTGKQLPVGLRGIPEDLNLQYRHSY